MKTRILSHSFLATLAIALGMISWGSTLHAQNAPSTTPDQQAQQPSSAPDTTPPAQTPETPSPSMPQNGQDSTPSSQSQQPPAQTPDATNPPDSTQAPSRTPNSGSQQSATGAGGSDTQTFSGTVTKQGDKYVLKDDSGHTYDIDHQDEVKKFDGKRVRVQGTLDPTGNKIMVK